MRRPRFINQEDFLNELLISNKSYAEGKFKVTGTFSDIHHRITCECKIHGEWRPFASNLLYKGSGCPKCASLHNGANRSARAVVDAKKEIAKNQNNLIFFDDFNSFRDIKVSCPIHGELNVHFYSTSNIAEKECPKCKANRVFKEKLYKANEKYRNGLFKVTGDYKGSHQPIECYCKKHGYWNTSVPASLLAGVGCPKCSQAKPRETNKTAQIVRYFKNNPTGFATDCANKYNINKQTVKTVIYRLYQKQVKDYVNEKEKQVIDWVTKNPDKNINDCIKELNFAPATVMKYFDTAMERRNADAIY